MSTKISQLTSATDITASDLMQIVDVEDGVMAPSGTNKKITAQLLADDLAGIVSAGSIATSKLASGALPSGVTVSSVNIVNGTIVNNDISSSAAIDLSKLESGALPSDITVASANIINGTIIDANINASAAIAGSKISPSFTAPSVISVGSSSDALRITQTGTGNALVVEDSSPDVTPLVIDSSGRIITNHDTPLNLNGSGGFPRIQSHAASGTFADSASAYVNWQNGTGASGIFIAKSRGGAVGTYGAVVNSDSVGEIRFACDDGEKFNSCAKIQAEIDGGVGIDDIPCRLTFGTVPSGSNVISERMRITSAGNVGIATTTPSSKLHVAGDLTMSSATVATSATAGTNGDVPAQVAGYLVVNINGTARKIPYYA
jgi:hypothetical protein